MNVYQIITTFKTESDFRNYLIRKKWSTGIRCTFCEGQSISKRRNSSRYKCNNCNHSFSVTSGTILHATKIPLSKWFLAISIITSAKKGISSLQLARDLGVNKNTAWYLQMRIRAVMDEDPTIGGIIEPMKLRSRTKRSKSSNIHKEINWDQLSDIRSIKLSSKRNSNRRQIITMSLLHKGKGERTKYLFIRAITGQYHRLNSEYCSNYIREIEIKAKYKSGDLFKLLLSRCLGNCATW